MATATATNERPATAAPGAQRRTFAPGDDQRQYDHEVLEINRVVRVVKGGRRFSFRASVVVGNREGLVGLGVGKSKDVQSAIAKAYDQGAKSMVSVALVDGTVPHEVIAKAGGARVMVRPARSGTGIIAGGTVRLVAELVGIRDVVSKRLGSPNKLNTARATVEALGKLKSQKSKVKSTTTDKKGKSVKAQASAKKES